MPGYFFLFYIDSIFFAFSIKYSYVFSQRYKKNIEK